jgi:hypothetical protein
MDVDGFLDILYCSGISSRAPIEIDTSGIVLLKQLLSTAESKLPADIRVDGCEGFFYKWSECIIDGLHEGDREIPNELLLMSFDLAISHMLMTHNIPPHRRCPRNIHVDISTYAFRMQCKASNCVFFRAEQDTLCIACRYALNQEIDQSRYELICNICEKEIKQHEKEIKQHEKEIKQHEKEIKQHEKEIKQHEKVYPTKRPLTDTCSPYPKKQRI